MLSENLPSYQEYLKENRRYLDYLIKRDNKKNFPGYHEYLKIEQESERNKTLITPELTTSLSERPIMQPDSSFVQFPSIQLCNDFENKNFVYLIYCYALLALYLLITVGFIIWQIRYIKSTRNFNFCNRFCLGNGQRSNRRNYESELEDPKILSRMLPKGQNS